MQVSSESLLLFLSAGLFGSVLLSVENCQQHGAAEIRGVQLTAAMSFKRSHVVRCHEVFSHQCSMIVIVLQAISAAAAAADVSS